MLERQRGELAAVKARHHDEQVSWRREQSAKEKATKQIPTLEAKRRKLLEEAKALGDQITALGGSRPEIAPLPATASTVAAKALVVPPRSASTPGTSIGQLHRIDRIGEVTESGPSIRCPRCREQIPVSAEEIKNPALRTDIMQEHMSLDCEKRPGVRHAAAMTR
jgi:hypothetical protein